MKSIVEIRIQLVLKQVSNLNFFGPWISSMNPYIKKAPSTWWDHFISMVKIFHIIKWKYNTKKIWNVIEFEWIPLKGVE